MSKPILRMTREAKHKDGWMVEIISEGEGSLVLSHMHRDAPKGNRFTLPISEFDKNYTRLPVREVAYDSDFIPLGKEVE